MYDNFNNNYTTRPHGAFEIEQRARELEKRYALMNLVNHSERSNGLAETLGKAARRIGSMIGSLFM
jgi:triosephosphate isomerase